MGTYTLSFLALMFYGDKNRFLITKQYYSDFGCRFELQDYPFDTQVCKTRNLQMTLKDIIRDVFTPKDMLHGLQRNILSGRKCHLDWEAKY